MGIQGLGAVNGSMIGSVCERVVRRISTDILITKNNGKFDKKILVAVDGSSNSMAGVKSAVAIGRAFGIPVEIVSAFDPNFHSAAFKILQECFRGGRKDIQIQRAGETTRRNHR